MKYEQQKNGGNYLGRGLQMIGDWLGYLFDSAANINDEPASVSSQRNTRLVKESHLKDKLG